MAISNARDARRSKRKAKRTLRRAKRTGLADGLAAVATRGWTVGAALISVLRVATAAVLVVATAAAAASLVSKPVQRRITRQIAGGIRDVALNARQLARQI